MRFTLGAPAAAAPPPPSYQEQAPTATFGGQPPGYGPPPGYGAPPGYPTAPTGYQPPPQPGYGAAPPGYGAAPPGYGAAPQQPPRPAAKPLNPTFGEMTPDSAKADGEEGPRLPKRASKFQTQILVGVAILSVCCAGVAIWFKVTHRTPGGVSGTEIYKDKDRNFSLKPPPRPWTSDETMRSKLGSPYVYVYKREEPEAYMAFGAKDYAPSSPRPSQLEAGLDQALDKLLERDTRKKMPDDDKTWMGQETRGYKFSGILKSGGSVEGDARAFGYKGVGYWFLSWTGAGDVYDSQRPAFLDARKRCELLELRKDWKEKQSSVVAYKNNVIPYTILDAEGMWEEITDEAQVKAEDPKADKFLRSTKDKKKKDHQAEAECVVLLLDGGANPLADARAYLEAETNKLADLRGKTTFSEHTGELQGDPTPNTVEGNAEHVLLKSVNERDPGHAWFYAVSAIKVGDKTVAVIAKCLFVQRGAFDTKFVQLVKSLRGS